MWWSSPNDPASRLSWYWNARGSDREAAAHQAGLDPSLLETIELLHTVDDVHEPDPAVVDRMERTLMNTIALSPSRYDTLAVSTAGHNGRVIPLVLPSAPAPLPRAGARRHGLFGAVATAAIVVLVVIASLVIVHPDRRAPLAPAPAVLPAISGTPVADDAATTETLLDTAIATIPVGRANLELDFWHISPEARPLPVPALGGTQIVLVESGEVAVNTAEPLVAGEQTAVTGGETAFLTAPAGDASLFTVHLSAGSLEPAKEVQLGVAGTSFDYLIYVTADGLPGGSGRLVLERITVPPGETMASQEAVRWSWTEVGSGELGLTLDGERLPFRWKSGTERTFRFSQKLPLLQPGTRMTFRNAGDDPLVLYRLTLVPTDGAATPTAQVAMTETLVEAMSDSLPADHAVIAVERVTLQPGSPAMIMPPMDGLVIVTAQSGAIVATRGSTETPLALGEPFVASQQEVGLRAAGPEEATALAVYVISAFVDATGYGSDPLVHRVDRLIETSASDLPGGIARLVVERLTLAPGGALSPEEARPWVWTEVGDGALGLTLEGEQLPFRWKSGAERTFRSGQYLPPIRPGTRMTFRNVGDDPLVLYRLTLASTDGAATPAT